MSNFQQGFQVAADQFLAEAIARQVDSYAERVEASVEELIRDMGRMAINQKVSDYVKGDVAEVWHAGTIDVDAVRRGIDVKAFVPRDASPIDVALMGEGSGAGAQLKFYRSAETTAKAISDPKYQGLEKVVPTDQLESVREAAAHLASKNVERPEVAAAYEHTARVADDRLRMDGAESRPLTEQHSRDLVQQLRRDGVIDKGQFGLTADELIQWQEVLRDSTSVAVRAALLAAALQAAPYLIEIARKGIETGEISAADFAPLGRALPVAVLRSGLAGGLTAVIVGAAHKELLGESLKALDPTLVSAAVVLCMCAVTNSIQAARGEISMQEAAARTAGDAFTLAVSMGFAAASQALIPIPLLGALVGNIVGAVVARLVIDNANEAILGLAVETGWTFFGLVQQDHTVPAHFLSEAGWHTTKLEKIEPRSLELRRLETSALNPATIDVQVLRRGVVAFRRVGYVT